MMRSYNYRFLSLLLTLSLALFLVHKGSCVEEKEKELFSPRIINGHVSKVVRHAARVTGFSMAYSTEGSGTFVSRQHVVTAGSIIDGMGIMTVYFGNESLVGAISSLPGLGFVHPEYDRETFLNDIGIIVLGQAALEDVVIPVALPTSLQSTPMVGDVGVVSGFGLRKDAIRGWTLNFLIQTGSFRVINRRRCQDGLGEQQGVISETHFCTDSENRLCFGDFGSGLTVGEVNGVPVLIGIVSVITNMCHGTYPVLYTRVALYTQWIQQQING